MFSDWQDYIAHVYLWQDIQEKCMNQGFVDLSNDERFLLLWSLISFYWAVKLIRLPLLNFGLIKAKVCPTQLVVADLQASSAPSFFFWNFNISVGLNWAALSQIDVITASLFNRHNSFYWFTRAFLRF